MLHAPLIGHCARISISNNNQISINYWLQQHHSKGMANTKLQHEQAAVTNEPLGAQAIPHNYAA